MQLDVNVDYGCERWTSLMSMSRSSLSVHHLVSQVQQLLSEEHTVRRQVSCGGKSAQKKNALASVQPLQCCGGRLCRDSAEKCPSPAPAFHPPAARRPRCRRRCSRDEDRRTALGCGVASPHHRAREPSPAENKRPHTEANQAIRDLMAAQTQTQKNLRERRCRHRLVLLCQSRIGKVVVTKSAVERRDFVASGASKPYQ